MCEAAVFLEKDGSLEQVMEDVVELRPEGDKLLLIGIFGDQKMVSARIKEARLMDHTVILKEKGAD